jgi:hypothetical protein
MYNVENTLLLQINVPTLQVLAEMSRVSAKTPSTEQCEIWKKIKGTGSRERSKTF